MTVLEIFRLIALEFASVTGIDAQKYIDLVTSQVSSSCFGDDYKLAIAYLAAHTLALANRVGGESGSVTMKKEGELSFNFSGNNGDLMQLTSYGQQFLALQKKHIVGFIVLNS